MIFVSCKDSRNVQIWTDSAEFAFYGDLFNASQNQYKVSVRYIEYPAANLGQVNQPDIVAASWLKNASTGSIFKSLDNLFGANKLSRNVFNPKLLAIGRIDRNQYLLPVSFNIPALIFSDDTTHLMSNQFTVDFNEIKTLGRNFNVFARGAYTRMGFSPLWSDEFLHTAAVLSGTSFREADPLEWDSEALESAMVFINNWTNEINTNNQADEEFTFKYFYESPQRLVQSRRILFSFIKSNDLFKLGEDIKNNLDFRWIMEQDRIPVMEDSVYLGIPKRAKALKGARAFILWFFKIESQRIMLEYSRTNRINENTFGICGGFSALSPVTEQIYPLFYPELLGRMPPSDNLVLPNVLPSNWAIIKQRVILPYLNERARKDNADGITSLEKRLSDWIRMNR